MYKKSMQRYHRPSAMVSVPRPQAVCWCWEAKPSGRPGEEPHEWILALLEGIGALRWESGSPALF